MPVGDATTIAYGYLVDWHALAPINRLPASSAAHSRWRSPALTAGDRPLSYFFFFPGFSPANGISICAPMRSLLTAMSSIQATKPVPAAAW